MSGNPELEPETAQSFQLGGIWIPIDELEWEVTLYLNRLEGLIATTSGDDSGGGDEPIRFGYSNIDRARTRGVETVVRVRPTEGWMGRAGYTLTDTLNRSTGKPLEGRARHRMSFELRSDRLPLGMEASSRASVVGPRPFYTNGTEELDETEFAPVHALWEARLARDFGKYFTGFIRDTNLLDAGDVRYLPISPRTLSAGVVGQY